MPARLAFTGRNPNPPNNSTPDALADFVAIVTGKGRKAIMPLRRFT
jgi:hypothetical protein